MSRIRRLRRWWPAIPIVLAALIVYAAWPGRWTYTITPETTYVTEPINEQGLVDYPTALNERLSKGITPENNANVLIWQALGPHPEGSNLPAEYFRWLGTPPPPEAGDYLIDWSKYFQDHLKDRPNDIVDLLDQARDWREVWDERMDRARKWPWKPSEQPSIADWLKQNEKPLAVAIEASKRPEYYNPLVSKSTDARTPRLIASLLPSVQKCRELANALTTRAMLRVGQDNFDGAWQDLLACQRLGRLVGRRGTLIEALVGFAMVSMASDGEITLLGHSQHSSQQLRAWLKDLQHLPAFPSLAERVDLSERLMVLDSFQSMACGGIQQLEQLVGIEDSGRSKRANPLVTQLFKQSVDWDPAFRNANQTFDKIAAALRLPDRAARTGEMAKIFGSLKTSKADAFSTAGIAGIAMSKSQRGATIGNILLNLLLPALEKIQDAADRVEQFERNLHIAFALAAYRVDNGRYPAKLDELFPKYLAKVPDDVFAAKPLNFKPTEKGYLLYSVGANGIDDGGQWYDDNPKGDDPRVRMPVTEPKRKKR